MDKIPIIRGGSATIRFITHKEWDEMESKAIPFGEWHFERYGRGVKPVKGKYDPSNPNHVAYSEVITHEEF